MRVIARSTLDAFVRNKVERKLQRVLDAHLDVWYAEVVKAAWKSPAELKQQYSTASIVSAERVVFNIKGNDYRLVAAISYKGQTLLIKWIGTHKEYDAINVATVEFRKERYGNSADSDRAGS